MEKTYLQEVGERLAMCRNHSFISRKELARRAEVSLHTVACMERGDGAVGICDAVKICRVLGQSTDYILTGNCGLSEWMQMNRTLFDLPEVPPEQLEKVARAFWNAYPKECR